jgi:tetratricopeptide (TPR) repeat protein
MIALMVVTVAFINIAIYLISRDKDKNKIYSLGFLSATLVLILSSFIYRVEGTILILGGLFGSLTMAIIFVESGIIEDRCIRLSLKASPKFALTLAFIFIIVSAGVATLFVYVGKAYVADIYAGNAIREKEVTESGSIASLKKAINLNGKEGRYYSRVGQEYMVLANQEALKKEGQVDTGKLTTYVGWSVNSAKLGVEKMPNDALAVSVLAQIYESLSLHVSDTLELAGKSYNDLLLLEPHNPVAYLKLGQIEIIPAIKEKDEAKKKASIKEAKDYFDKSISEKNNLAESYYYLAITQNALDQRDDSISSMEKAVAYEKSNVTYLFNLGRAYQERGTDVDMDNARKIFEYIITVNPEEVNTIFALGSLYEKKGEKDKAIEKYKKVVEIVQKISDNSKDTVAQLNKMIENVRNGISNSNVNLDNQAVKQSGSQQNQGAEQNVELIGSDPAQNPVTNTNPPVNPGTQINQ